MRGREKSFWGIAFLLGAVAILMSRLGYLNGIGFWSILFNVFLLAMLIKGIISLKIGTVLFSIALLITVDDEILHLKEIGFWTILFNVCLIMMLIKGLVSLKIGTALFSLAFLIILNDKLLHLEAITPWPVLGAALLGTIGANLLFPRFGRHWDGHLVKIEDGHNSISEYSQVGESVSYGNVFGQSAKYISGVIGQVKIENGFGTTQIYFTEAQLKEGRAFAEVSSAFGSVVFYVPMSWKVELNTENVFGSSVHKGNCSPDGENVLHVRGSVVFGSLEVISV